MSSKPPLTRFLLVYLVLFLNFGPSFHRADLFGVHDEGGASTCVCSATTDSADGAIQSEHDCAFCRYFDLLQIDITEVPQWTQESFVTSYEFRTETLIQAGSISPHARGPPLLTA